MTDARHFSESSSDLSVPTVAGDLKSLSLRERDQYIGRQSSGFSASGDVRLNQGATVTGKVTELVGEGLARLGFQPGARGVPVQVTVLKFWAWSTPNVSDFTIRAQVRCRITVKGRTFEVQGDAKNIRGRPTTENWQQAYDEAFEDFIRKLELELLLTGL